MFGERVRQWRGRMTERQKDWLIRAGGYASAIVVVAGVVGWIWITAFGIAVAPLSAEIKAERVAREKADDRIANQFVSLSRDRLDLIDLMLTTSPVDRERKLRLIHEKWATTDAQIQPQPEVP